LAKDEQVKVTGGKETIRKISDIGGWIILR
jgi:hypothetical protein